MAGSFGFEAEKYGVSVKIGKLVLLPAVRSAAPDTLIITDGFSCYQQIEGLTGRKALHITEVLQMAIAEPSTLDSKAKENSPQIYADVRR